MWAVLSCIHGNLEALDAVLADIAKYPISKIICLGDLVGYGPNPVECIERALAWDLLLTGNFEHALQTNDFDGWGGEPAVRSVVWSRERASERGISSEIFNVMLPHHRMDDFLFVHGSPRNPLHEYHFPEDVYNERKMARVSALMERYCFCGHTHMPGVFIEPKAGQTQWQFLSPNECNSFYRLDGRKTIVNVGSVGQQRDTDWRACYVIVDGLDVTFRRVEYDVDTTIAKIHAIPELDNFLGDRLREGR
jgi:diadenosine tetraphosphatase ApaH/serine/threonine PP2A family protein phosphatase